jgi:SAM-dependent methyltransferase
MGNEREPLIGDTMTSTDAADVTAAPPEASRWAGFRGPSPRRSVSRIINAYDSFVVKAYCVVRFRIIRGRFLEEIGQFLPRSARVTEIGCGFGLFSLYFADRYPDLTIHGVDIDEGRIQMADRARRRLGLHNVTFAVDDARQIHIDEGVDACYLLDILHHIPRASTLALIAHAHEQIRPGGVLIIKDVDTRPRYKMAFTWLLDVIMTKGERPDYWSAAELTGELYDAGFSVIRYAMTDLLPYPHQLFVCLKASAT